MVSDLVGLVVGLSPIFGLLLWHARAGRQRHAADVLRADVQAGAARLLDGTAPLAVNVRPPTAWRPGFVRLSMPGGCEPLIGRTFQTVAERVPRGYEVVIRCGERA
jgi:hypothetical protein